MPPSGSLSRRRHPLLGLDQTRSGRPRWLCDPDSGTWRLSDSWQTGLVDLPGQQGLLGQVTGRTSKAVVDWLDAHGPAWKQAVEVVAMDPAARYRNAVQQALTHTVIVVDHFHLVGLANRMVTGEGTRADVERGRVKWSV